MFKGAKFLQMEDFAKCIAAKIVTEVYYKPTLQGYQEKKKDLKKKTLILQPMHQSTMYLILVQIFIYLLEMNYQNNMFTPVRMVIYPVSYEAC